MSTPPVVYNGKVTDYGRSIGYTTPSSSSSSGGSSGGGSSSTPPPKYNTITGFVTDYGKSVGAKPVQAGDPGGGNSSWSGSSGGGGSSAPLTPTIVIPPQTTISSDNLQVGSRGQSVKDLQTQLGITADGIFGSQTQAAVKAYQTANGLVSDGIVGNQTAGKMNGSSASNIASTDLTNKNTPITTYTPPANDYASILNGIAIGTTSLADMYKFQADQAAKNQTDITALYTNLMNEKPSAEQIYNDAMIQSGKEEAQKKFNELSSQITGINAAAQTAMQTLESQAGGKGVTSAFLGRQQQEISRSAAIQALPISAELQAAQGNLEMANENLNTLFTLKSQDTKATFDYKVKLVDSLAQYATDQEKMQMEYIIKAEQRSYDALTKNQDAIKQLTITAAQNGASASTLTAISNANYNDALILSSKYLTDPLDRQIKLANLNKLKADTAKTKAEADTAKKIGEIINLDPTSKTYTEQMIDGSKGGRTMTQSEVLPITKGLTVINQISSLQQTLAGQDTGPIIGILRDNNPYDIKAKLIGAQLQALIPNLARGVYGEVGVLTNQDIDNYKQTLGNIKTPQDANNLLMAMTLSTIKSSLDNNFQTMAAAGRDVSGFKGIYSNLKTQLDTLNNNLGVSQISNNANSYLDSALPQEAPVSSGPINWLNNFFYGKK